MEILLYFAVMFVGYIIWIKIKAKFTGRTFSEQTQYDSDRNRQEVCRNCKHCMLGTSCEYFDWDIDVNRDVCDYYEHK